MGIIETIEVAMPFYFNPKSLETSPSKAEIYILVVFLATLSKTALVLDLLRKIDPPWKLRL